MMALDQVVRQGKALYAGISMYQPDDTRRAAEILRELGTPSLIHQPVYSMFNRWVEDGLMDVLDKQGMGCIAFSPLAQGLLTNKYLAGVPADSRAAKDHGFLQRDSLTEETLYQVKRLNDIAAERGQSLAQMAIAWVLRLPGMTSALVGASRVSQLEENVAALQNLAFAPEEMAAIEAVLAE